ncbi:MAG: flippase [Rhodoferax sp.]|uniref:flippase n=1 Tax=Rhodoferax sp. TaxID=50421 RepID=UPI003BAFA281
MDSTSAVTQSSNWLNLLPRALQQRLHGRHNLLAVLQNSGWLVLDKMLRLALGLLVGAWVARYLGPAQYGELAYVLAYIAFFQAVATLGLDGIVVRDIAQNRDQASTVLGTAFALRLSVGVICWIAAIGSMAWLNGLHDRSVLLTALAGGSLVFQAADTVDLWFQSQSQSRLTVLAKLTAYSISSGVKVALILSGAPLVAFAAVMVLDGLTAAIGLAVAYKRLPCSKRWSRAASTARQLLSESWPFILSGISIMVYMRIDQIMIKEMLGTQQLGIYAAVLPLATLWQFIPMMLNASLAPFVARKKAESEAAYWQALQKIFKAYALLGWLVCIPTVVFANLAVSILYGSQYQQGAMVLSIYVFTNFSINMGVAQGLWLLNERKAIISLARTIIGALITIIGNWLLIPYFGITGVAVVAVVAMAIAAIFSNIFFSKKILALQIKSLLLINFYKTKYAH